MFLLPSYHLFYHDAAFWAEAMAFAQSGTTLRTVQFDAGFEALDGYHALGKTHIFHSESQGFTDTTTQSRQKPDEKFVSNVSCCFFHRNAGEGWRYPNYRGKWTARLG